MNHSVSVFHAAPKLLSVEPNLVSLNTCLMACANAAALPAEEEFDYGYKYDIDVISSNPSTSTSNAAAAAVVQAVQLFEKWLHQQMQQQTQMHLKKEEGPLLDGFTVAALLYALAAATERDVDVIVNADNNASMGSETSSAKTPSLDTPNTPNRSVSSQDVSSSDRALEVVVLGLTHGVECRCYYDC